MLGQFPLIGEPFGIAVAGLFAGICLPVAHSVEGKPVLQYSSGQAAVTMFTTCMLRF